MKRFLLISILLIVVICVCTNTPVKDAVNNLMNFLYKLVEVSAKIFEKIIEIVEDVNNNVIEERETNLG